VEELVKPELTRGLAKCQVRSKTDRPCPRPAVVEIWAMSFCERCAREQEAYFAIGALTQAQGFITADRKLAGHIAQARKRY
jgi:hypothetical protein